MGKSKAESAVTKKENPYFIKIVEGSTGEPLLDSASFQKDDETGVVVGDMWGYITDANEAIVKMTEACDKKEIVGKHVLEFLVKEEKAKAIERSLKLVVEGQNITKNYRVRSLRGKELLVEVRTEVLVDKQGDRIGFVDIVKRLSK